MLTEVDNINILSIVSQLALAFVAISLSYGVFSAESSSQVERPVNPIPYNTASLKRGKFSFIQNCANCHDRDGKARTAAMGNAADLTVPESWLYGASDGEIFRTISDGAGSSMPPFKYTIMNENKRWDIVNFVHSLRSDARALEE